MNSEDPKPKIVISNSSRVRISDLGELLTYRFLIFLFVRKDFVAKFKQNILGPLWFVIQPLFTTLVFTVVFGGIAKIPTEGTPGPLFYMCGLCMWNYFSTNFTSNSTIFLTNAPLYSKVYFPRLSIPISNLVSNLIGFGVQFFLFCLFWIYYRYWSGLAVDISINWTAFLMPIYLGILGVLSLGIGMIFSSVTSKYRDLTQMSAFLIQLGMYLTPVIYPMANLEGQMLFLMKLNPVASVIECFRHSFLGIGIFDWQLLGYAAVVSFFVFMLSIFVFQKTQKRFVDTI